MVTDILQPTHLLLLLVVALIVLGPKRLPEVGRQLGNGLRDFRNAINGERDSFRDAIDFHRDERHSVVEESFTYGDRTNEAGASPSAQPDAELPARPQAESGHEAGEGEHRQVAGSGRPDAPA